MCVLTYFRILKVNCLSEREGQRADDAERGAARVRVPRRAAAGGVRDAALRHQPPHPRGRPHLPQPRTPAAAPARRLPHAQLHIPHWIQNRKTSFLFILERSTYKLHCFFFCTCDTVLCESISINVFKSLNYV